MYVDGIRVQPRIPRRDGFVNERSGDSPAAIRTINRQTVQSNATMARQRRRSLKRDLSYILLLK